MYGVIFLFCRILNLYRYGDCIFYCNVYIFRGIYELDNDIVLRYVCVIANSGGGIFYMQNVDYKSGVCFKDLDIWWSGMEIKLVVMILFDDICNYFDMVGNYDEDDFYFFVKTFEYICIINYYSRLLIDTVIYEVSYQSVIKLLQKEGFEKLLVVFFYVFTDYYYGIIYECFK